MYLTHFDLSEKPFSLTPDTQFYLNEKSHKDALSTLVLAIKEGEGYIKIVGEVGTGKTLLCRILLSKLDRQRFVTAYIPNPWLSPDELKAFIALEVGAEYSKVMPAHELTSSIYRRLMQLARQDKQVVLVVDEAQSMPRETIEALRLISNLETEKRKLIQVVLLGQPELNSMLKRRDLRQLNQRIVFAEYLRPLSCSDVKLYIQHRLAASGCEDNKLFSRLAVWVVYRASKGIPRLINIIAHKAMLSAYGKGDKRVNSWHAARAVCDTPESTIFSKVLSWLFRVNYRLFFGGNTEVSP